MPDIFLELATVDAVHLTIRIVRVGQNAIHDFPDSLVA
jgi:hypothetical protein